jgi:hypothetical protein
MSALRELLAVFDIVVDPEHNLEKGDEKVEEFVEKLKKVGETVAEAFGAERLYEFVKEQVEANVHLENLSEQLGVSASDIRSFSLVTKGAGVDLDGTAAALGFFEKTLGGVGAKGAKAQATLKGLDVETKNANGTTRDLTDILGDAAEGLSKVTDQNKRAAIASELFGRSMGRALLPVLAQGREGFEDAMKEAAALGDGLGDDFYRQTKKAAEGFEAFTHVLQSLKNRALAAILPGVELLGVLLKGVGVFLLDLDKRTHVVQAAFVTLAIVIGAGLAAALYTAAVAAWALVAPFLISFGPIIALVAGLVWVIQDLWNLMTGGPSIIGNIIEKLGGVGDKKAAIGQLHEAWTALIDGISGAAYVLGYFVGMLVGMSESVGGSAFGHGVLDFFLTLIKFALSAARIVGGFFGMIGHGIAAIAKAASLDSEGMTKEFAAAGKSVDAAGNAVFGKKGILGEAGIGQHSTNLADYGVDPDLLSHRHAKSQTFGHGEGADRKARDQTFGHGAAADERVAMAPHVGGGIAAPHVTNHVETHVVVNTKSDKPKEVGAETASAVSSATQRDRRNALASVVKP